MDDVTIEDEFELNEDKPFGSKSEFPLRKSFSIFQILSQPWIIFILLSIALLIFIYINRNRRRNRNLIVDYEHIQHETNKQKLKNDQFNQYDDMERIRQKQQKAYEEQALRHAEQKKAKIESSKPSIDENPNRSKYRSSDHNPLTGQSNRGSSDSCSWRPSSRQKPGGG
ncbi:unnamed protein product [Rotaria sordida]|uniref:Selenoprotein S n=1 Tax=Rotaria sordida TaxID=392033 RepID=A0A819IHL0_9BILA|nr:unnamed protein product [Rotaria sordida]CAF0811802.1 unnamed protein product [Rotaria sordida]CAF0818804.1 unnamed protein product [Rotaria sordida]CAF0832731.1 unnamed protein product [Rotaria sordida]CAF3913716.1 unnamed protein product [Rotaria sordida]